MKSTEKQNFIGFGVYNLIRFKFNILKVMLNINLFNFVKEVKYIVGPGPTIYENNPVLKGLYHV